MLVSDLVVKRGYTLIIISEAGPSGDALFSGETVKAYSLKHAFEMLRYVDGGLSVGNDFWQSLMNCKRYISELEELYLDDIEDIVGRFTVSWVAKDYSDNDVYMCFLIPEDKVDEFVKLSNIGVM